MSCPCDGNGNPILPDWPLFRLQFPQFSDAVKYPDNLLQMYWDEMTCFVCDANYGQIIGRCRLFLLNLFVAHMMTIMLKAAAGGGKQVGFKTSATIDKVSVSTAAPPAPNMFRYWLGLTPYGLAALAMLEANTVGGDYIGGLPETAGFRRVGGGFFPGVF